ncbi:MAG: hypothetical protein BV459_04960 [Thermoplasmata archaeon M11B2D]|nr:MAG: hypothetical protein BV459_04960 [Thermoplasmata archaeon M11B2D]
MTTRDEIVLNLIRNTVGDGAVPVEQYPELLNQLMTTTFVGNFFLFCFFVILFAYIFYCRFEYFCSNDGELATMRLCLSSLCLMIGIGVGAFSFDWYYVADSPDIWLLEYADKLAVKK